MNLLSSFFSKLPSIRTNTPVSPENDSTQTLHPDILHTMEYLLSTIESSDKVQSRDTIEKFLQNSQKSKNIK